LCYIYNTGAQSTICPKNIVKKAFEYLEAKKMKHDKVKHINYNGLEMASYLKATSIELSIRKKQFLFQCRVSDIDLRANRTWKYAETHCIACQNKHIQETGYHILECKVLCEISQDISYIPDYNNLFRNDIDEQAYVSKVINSNMEARKSFLKEAMPLALVN
jgi:hypothetical protein